MKIAIDTLFEDAFVPSSAMDYLLNLALYLPEQAPEHEFFLLVSPRSASRFEPLLRSNLHRVNCLASNDRRTMRILAEQTVVPWRMRQYKIDLLFSPGNVTPWSGNFCRVLKINTLHHYRTPRLIGLTRSIYRRFAFRASARCADAVMANSEETRHDICHYIGTDPAKVCVVWEAVDECFMPVGEEDRQRARQRYGLNRPYVLFSSTLWPYKNAHTLLCAFARMIKRNDMGVDLVFAGRPGTEIYQRQLQTIIAGQRLAERVHFLGFVPNRAMPELYCAARLFVYPSLSETFGKPLVEAMRCGVPVVASNTSCIPEITGGAALLVDPESEDQLADAMEQVLCNEALSLEMAACGLRRGAEFSWKSSARQTLDLLETTYAAWRKRHAVAEKGAGCAREAQR